jgi:hypothetical protein
MNNLDRKQQEILGSEHKNMFAEKNNISTTITHIMLKIQTSL